MNQCHLSLIPDVKCANKETVSVLKCLFLCLFVVSAIYLVVSIVYIISFIYACKSTVVDMVPIHTNIPPNQFLFSTNC